MQIHPLTAVGKDYLEWQDLLHQSGLKPEKNLDEIWAIYEDGQMIATGARQANILKCIAVKQAYQGTKAFDLITAKLLQSSFEYNLARKEEIEEASKKEADIFVLAPGWDSVFVYTTTASAQAFSWFGFDILAYVDNELVFMEKAGDSKGLKGYLSYLQASTKEWKRDNFYFEKEDEEQDEGKKKPISALVMNANPFTLGHLYLLETAAQESELVHLFVLSEESADFSSFERMKMVREGTIGISNLLIHPSSSYLVSAATFPAYFIADEKETTLLQARLDAKLFLQELAPALGIERRYLGTEENDFATAVYNQALIEVFKDQLELKILARKKSRDNEIISASLARKYWQAGKWQELSNLVPFTTFIHLRSKKAGKDNLPDEEK